MTTTTKIKTGNRIAIPAEGTAVCASCRTPRGNQRKGWEPIIRDGQVVGFTCPACPRAHEPVRRIETRTGVRFRVCVDATPRGAAKRKQVTVTAPTLEEARAEVARIRADVERLGHYQAPAGETVEALLARWIKTQDGQVRAITLDSKDAAAKAVVRLIGGKDITKLTVADIRTLAADLAERGGRPLGKAGKPRPLGRSAVSKALTAIRLALEMAVDDKIISENPARKVKAPKEQVRSGKKLEHWETVGRGADAHVPEMEQWLKVADTDPWAAGWRLSSIGLRRSEIMGLQWANVDLEAGTIEIIQGRVLMADGTTKIGEPKSKASHRVLPIDSEITEQLRRLAARQAADRIAAGDAWVDSGLVLTDELGAGVKPDRYSDRFADLCLEAGVRKINLHSVRHSFAFWAHASGEMPADVAAWLGHDLLVHLNTYMPSGGTAGIASVGRSVYRSRESGLRAVGEEVA